MIFGESMVMVCWWHMAPKPGDGMQGSNMDGTIIQKMFHQWHIWHWWHTKSCTIRTALRPHFQHC